VNGAKVDAVAQQPMDQGRPLGMLICALGGEGGGVLAEWLIEVAIRRGHASQASSIPGVAQRTGATTYYVEIFPRPEHELPGLCPVFSLNPVPGALDLLVSSELLETVRQIGNGMATAERTVVISSQQRALTTAEKMPLGDGRASRRPLLDVVHAHSRSAHVFDMAAIVDEEGTVMSAVLFGALAAHCFITGVLPFARDDYEAVVSASGKGVPASLRGFARAWDAVCGVAHGRAATQIEAGPISNMAAAQAPEFIAAFSPVTHDMLLPGHARVLEYQDAAYAALYVERLRRVFARERAVDPSGTSACAITRETARYLALWMAFDDIVRVADLKCRASRSERVRREVKAVEGEIVRVYDHFKPGVPEFAALLPTRWAQALQAWERRRLSKGREPLALPLAIGTHSVGGFLALRALAGLKWLRRVGSRFALEQAMIERWLDAIEAGTQADWSLGHEVALCGRLIKGYGTTNERGKRNLLHLLDHLAMVPKMGTPAERAQAIRATREAALADDAGVALDRTLVAHGAPARPADEQPIRWMRRPPGRDNATATGRR
jgi:indolepyruvate ferredoxin oxidoreductase beta subunit